MENKKEFKIEENKNTLHLENRAKLSITGIEEVISFNEEEINLVTGLGALKIKGSNLKMNKLDVQNGDLVIIGEIDSCIYANKEKKKENDSILSRLFK